MNSMVLMAGAPKTYVCPKDSANAGGTYTCNSGTMGCMPALDACCESPGGRSCPYDFQPAVGGGDLKMGMTTCLHVEDDACSFLKAVCEKGSGMQGSSQLCAKGLEFCQKEPGMLDVSLELCLKVPNLPCDMTRMACEGRETSAACVKAISAACAQ